MSWLICVAYIIYHFYRNDNLWIPCTIQNIYFLILLSVNFAITVVDMVVRTRLSVKAVERGLSEDGLQNFALLFFHQAALLILFNLVIKSKRDYTQLTQLTESLTCGRILFKYLNSIKMSTLRPINFKYFY